VHERKTAALAETGLTIWGYVVLRMLTEAPGLSQAEVARRARVAPQSISTTFAELEAAGLIERRPASAHARVLEAPVAPAGRAARRRAEAIIERVEDELLAPEPPAERARLRRSLARLAALGPG